MIVLTSAVEAPVLALSAVLLLYLLHARLPRECRPGVVWHIVIVAGTLTYTVLAVQALISVVGDLKG